MRARWILCAILTVVPLASPSAQQSHLDTRSQVEQMVATFTERYNKQDAAALASMFTKDAVRVSSAGTAVSAGPQAIEETFKSQFAAGYNHIDLIVNQVSPVGPDAAITIGEYRAAGGPFKENGHWTEVEVREGGVWKIRLLTVASKIRPSAVTAGIETNSTGAGPEANSAGASDPATKKIAILIDIDKPNQKMTVFLDGVEKYDWPVSTGKAGYSTPSGTYTATSMNEIWYSKQWDNAPMPHSVFFMKDGHAIHGSNEVKNLGKPVSHVTPGGEFKSARGQTTPRSGSSGRSYGAQYYPGSQGYYYNAAQGYYYNGSKGFYVNGPQGYNESSSAYSRW
jgi:uncharacterized protein (TIGR02246 family)